MITIQLLTRSTFSVAVSSCSWIDSTDEYSSYIILYFLYCYCDSFRVLQIADKADVNESAKEFAGYWAEACRYQTTIKYHRMGDGPTAQKIRFGFQSAIKYIIICATHLADMDDGVEFKKLVSGYVKNSIIQSLIDQLQDVKVNK